MQHSQEQPAPPGASQVGNESSTPVARDDGARARQRMMMLGPEGIDDIDLLTLILGGAKAADQALSLLRHGEGLGGLVGTHPHQLACVPGVGAVRAGKVVAALELGRRALAMAIPYGRTIDGLDDLAFLHASIGSAPQEVFMVLGLDFHSRLRLVRTVAVGSLSKVYVEPREVFRPAMQAGLCKVILVHNHPSGEAEPSMADHMLSLRMVVAGEVLGIRVRDHLIVTRSRVVSVMKDGHPRMDE